MINFGIPYLWHFIAFLTASCITLPITILIDLLLSKPDDPKQIDYEENEFGQSKKRQEGTAMVVGTITAFIVCPIVVYLFFEFGILHEGNT